MNLEFLKLCELIETQVIKTPGIDLRSLDDDGGHGSRQHLENLLSHYKSGLNEEEKNRVIEEFCGSGPLQPLLKDSSVTEILVNQIEEIWYEKEGKLQKWNDRFFSHFTYQNFVQRLFSEAGVHIDLRQPAIDGSWGNFRFHAIGIPLSLNGTCLSLRRHPDNPWTLKDLEEKNWANSFELDRLQNLVKEKKSLLIIGTTGSGKTSVLSACLQKISPNERALVLEDTKEIALPNQISLRLLTRCDTRADFPPYTLADLIRQSLRMRPDRLIMGEVRGPEAKDLLLALSTGHQGGLATLHAKDPHEALMRLEVLIQLGAPQWRTETVRKLIFHGIQYVIITTKKEGHRQFSGAYKISSLEPSGFLMDREF